MNAVTLTFFNEQRYICMKQYSFVKSAIAVVCGLGLATAITAQASPIAQWTFEIGAPSAVPSAWNGTVGFLGTTPGPTFPVPSDISTYGNGGATGLHVTTGTMWVGPVGNGSLRSLSANQWLQNDYFQFTFTPTAGYSFSGISLAWDQTGSSSGPRLWNLQYSTDGSSFTTFGSDYSLAFFSWNSSTVQGNNESANLGGVLDSTLNSGGTVYFRVVDDSAVGGGAINNGNVGTGGTDRIDNFTIASTVTAVPEPSSLCLLGGFGLLGWHLIRRRS